MRDIGPTLDEMIIDGIDIIVSDSHGDFWAHNLLVVIAEARTADQRYAAWMPVSRLALDDIGRPTLLEMLRRKLDRIIRPWAWYDQPVMPPLHIFGRRLERFLAWIDRNW